MAKHLPYNSTQIDDFKTIFKIPKSWSIESSQYAFNEVRDGTHDSPKASDNGIPLITSKNLKPTGIDFSKTTLISKEDYEEIFKRSAVSTGDILFSMIGTIGNVGIVGKNTKFSIKNVALFRRNSEVLNSRYSFYWLKSNTYQDYLEAKKKGGNQKFVSLGVLRDSPVLIAPLNEQIRIADKLDSILAKVDATQARLDKIPNILKRFRQSVLAAATSGELTEEWRDENQVTFNWDEIKVSDIVRKIEAGKSIKCDERPPREDEFGIIKISAVTWGTYNEEESKTLKDKSIFLENRRVQVGDFLISRANTLELLGMPVIVHDVTKNLMLSDKVLRLIMDEIEKKWLNYFFRSPMGRTQIENGSSGNQESMRNIGQKALMSITLNNPPLDEKKEIIRRVESLFTMADTVEKQYKEAKTRTNRLTQSILAKAFRGELVEQDKNDESAEELLARILSDKEKKPSVKPKKKSVTKTTSNNIKMDNTVDETAVKKWIKNLNVNSFSSEDLHNSFGSNNEQLKEILFSLLKENKPMINKVFDAVTKDFIFKKV